MVNCDSRQLRKHRDIKVLIKEAKMLGFTVGFCHSGKDFGMAGARGVIDEEGKKITVCLTYRNRRLPIAHMLFVLAHEIRHAQHRRDGLYRSYYRKANKKAVLTIRVLARLYHQRIAVGVRAENDCDEYARNYLRSIGITDFMRVKKYPIKLVSGYSFYKKVRELSALSSKARVEQKMEMKKKREF